MGTSVVIGGVPEVRPSQGRTSYFGVYSTPALPRPDYFRSTKGSLALARPDFLFEMEITEDE